MTPGFERSSSSSTRVSKRQRPNIATIQSQHIEGDHACGDSSFSANALGEPLQQGLEAHAALVRRDKLAVDDAS